MDNRNRLRRRTGGAWPLIAFGLLAGGCAAGDQAAIEDADLGEAESAHCAASAPKWVSDYGYSNGWRVEKHPRFLADVDGDGKQDVVGFGDAGVYVSLSTGSSFTAPELWVRSYGYEARAWRIDKHPRFLADVNGDGKQDVVGFGNAGVYVSLSTGYSFAEPELWVADYGYEAGRWRVEKNPRFLADVNGDGKQDIVGFANDGVYVSMSTGYGFTAPSRKLGAFGYDQGWRVDKHPRFVTDINDDGKADIVGFGDDGVYVAMSTGCGFTAPSLAIASFGYREGWRVDKHPRLLADINGDSHLDIVGFGNDGVYVSTATPCGFSAPALATSEYGYETDGWRVDKHPRFVTDVNGDGLDDIIGFGDAGTYVSYSTGAGFADSSLVVRDFGYDQGWRVDKHPRLLGDVTGDGNPEIVGFGNCGVYVSSIGG